MEFLYTHLEPGSFRPTYADTDSMCLGLSKTATPKDDTTEAYYRNASKYYPYDMDHIIF